MVLAVHVRSLRRHGRRQAWRAGLLPQSAIDIAAARQIGLHHVCAIHCSAARHAARAHCWRGVRHILRRLRVQVRRRGQPCLRLVRRAAVLQHLWALPVHS